MKRGVQEGLGPGHVVLDRDPAPPKKFAQSPNFRPMSVVAKRLDGLRYHLPLGMEVGLGRGNFVLDGDPAPPPLPPKGGHIPPQFSAYVYYGQTAGWSKMPLSTEVGLGPGDNVLDGDRAPPNRAQPPIFGTCLLWPNGLIDQDATWYCDRPRPRRHCVRWGPAPPKGHALQFSAHIYAKRSPI